jgi:thiol:disulfide interchange protein DsbD
MLGKPPLETASDDSVPKQVALLNGPNPWTGDLADLYGGNATAAVLTSPTDKTPGASGTAVIPGTDTRPTGGVAPSGDIKFINIPNTKPFDASRSILDSRTQADSPLPPTAESAVLRPGDLRVPPVEQPQINWVDNDLYTAYNRATKEHKPLVIMFYADWCNYCKAMDKEAYVNPEFRKFAQECVFLKLNVEKDDQYQNTKQLMNRLDIKEFPALAVMQVDGPNPGLIGRIIGYHNGPQFVNVFRQVMPKDIVDRHPLDPNFRLIPNAPARPPSLNGGFQLAQNETNGLA